MKKTINRLMFVLSVAFLATTSTTAKAVTLGCGGSSSISFTDPWAAIAKVNDCWGKNPCIVWFAPMDQATAWCDDARTAQEGGANGGSNDPRPTPEQINATAQ